MYKLVGKIPNQFQTPNPGNVPEQDHPMHEDKSNN